MGITDRQDGDERAGRTDVPWDRAAPHPLIAEWMQRQPLDGRGRGAVLVGCEPSTWSSRCSPCSHSRPAVTPRRPPLSHDRSHPGTLLVVAASRAEDSAVPEGPPWPSRPAEIAAFGCAGLAPVLVEQLLHPDDAQVLRWQAEMRRPVSGQGTGRGSLPYHDIAFRSDAILQQKPVHKSGGGRAIRSTSGFVDKQTRGIPDVETMNRKCRRFFSTLPRMHQNRRSEGGERQNGHGCPHLRQQAVHIWPGVFHTYPGFSTDPCG
jgi:hypothetical protein